MQRRYRPAIALAHVRVAIHWLIEAAPTTEQKGGERLGHIQARSPPKELVGTTLTSKGRPSPHRAARAAAAPLPCAAQTPRPGPDRTACHGRAGALQITTAFKPHIQSEQLQVVRTGKKGSTELVVK
jgi:hypothetical protein